MDGDQIRLGLPCRLRVSLFSGGNPSAARQVLEYRPEHGPGGIDGHVHDDTRRPLVSKHFLFVSDFDQTLSFNDSGRMLSEMLGIRGFDEKVAGLAGLNLVQQGAELAYLLRHDPDFRRVRRDDLAKVGRSIRLKRNIALLPELLSSAIDGYHFEFHVVSAAPEEIVHSALEGIVPKSHILGTRLTYDQQSGEIASVERVAAGYGKVAAVDALRTER